MLGLPKGKLLLLDYTHEWRLEYEKEAAVLADLIGSHVKAIHHIGSTAVPGLSAKPIIDIAVELNDFDAGFSCVCALSGIGYTHRILGELPDRHYWSKGEPRTHQIHMFRPGSIYLAEALKFRDELVSNASLKKCYQELKVSLCISHRDSKHEYAKAKTEFIQFVLGITST